MVLVANRAFIPSFSVDPRSFSSSVMTLALQHDKVWPCVARGMVSPRTHTHDTAIDAIMRVLSPLQKGKEYTTWMDDRPSQPISAPTPSPRHHMCRYT